MVSGRWSFAVWFLYSGTVAFADPPALQITAPASGTVVTRASLTVSVTSPAGLTFTLCALFAESLLGFAGPTTSAPAEFSVPVPSDAPAGPYRITAFGVTASGSFEAVPVTVDVEREDLPSSLKIAPASVVLGASGQSIPLEVTAHYPDGTFLVVTKSSPIRHFSSQPSFVYVDSSGMVTAVSSDGSDPGLASITAMVQVGTQYQLSYIEAAARAQCFE